ncbi:MAG: hypothetical protein R2941_04315 [Desulfobacterales bacterium]
MGKEKTARAGKSSTRCWGSSDSGKIGSIVADRARGLKMQVIVRDPFVTPEPESLNRI